MSKCGVEVKFCSHRCFCNLPIEINAFGDVFKKEKLGGLPRPSWASSGGGTGSVPARGTKVPRVAWSSQR